MTLAPDFVRLERAARLIGDRQQHLTRTSEGFAKANERGYRVTITAPDGPEQRFHGRFDSVLRHTPDGWRMILDQDDDIATGVSDFDGARLLDDVEAFAPAATPVDPSRAAP